MKSRRRVNSTVGLLHQSIVRIVPIAVICLVVTLAVQGQEPNSEVHIKCPITRELLAQLDWPRVVRKVTPAYPALAAARRISGPVHVDVDIDSKGIVTAARVITGDKLLGDAAQKAALRWTFQPPDSVHSIPLTFVFREVTYVAPKDQPECGTSPYTVEILWSGITLTTGAT